MKCSQCRVKQDGLVGHTGNILYLFDFFFEYLKPQTFECLRFYLLVRWFMALWRCSSTGDPFQLCSTAISMEEYRNNMSHSQQNVVYNVRFIRNKQTTAEVKCRKEK